MSGITFYQYEKCTTCVKARKWLEAKGVKVQSRTITETPPSLDYLRDLWKRSGLPIKKFFNTSGNAYRSLPNKDALDTMSDEAKLELLAKDGWLIKRPILDDGKTVLVGFDEDRYNAWQRG
jgi:arsenate reductase